MKRFTCTEKWNHPWFRKLSPKLKCFLQFVWDKCDPAGIWEPDLEAASFFVGETISEDEAKNALNGQLELLASGKWFIKNFISFQYTKLSRKCIPHQKVYSSIETNLPHTLAVGYSDTLQEEEEDKDKEEEGKGSAEGKPEKSPPAATQLAEEIYKLYPKKVGKLHAVRAIEKALKLKPSDFLRERTLAFSGSVRGADMQFVPYPATWFNEGRYDDDPSTWKLIGRTNPVNGQQKNDKWVLGQY
jgi:hypothetical protein